MTLFFPRIQETSPFFQLLNEFDQSSRPSRCQQRPRHQQQQRTFTPSFDVKETEEGYQLYGELPGIAQSDINIEWADDKTISISGRSERKYQSTNVDAAPATPAAVAEEAKTPSQTASVTADEDFEEITNDQAGYQKPSVEDEAVDNGNQSAAAAASSSSEKSIEKSHQEPQVTAAAETTQPKHKYWISERSIGSFRRTFEFPIRVEHDQVRASLSNGILSIVIPKAKPLEPRKITIN